MSSRTQRVTVLAISKLLNYAVQFLTPILLVRILNREAYGQYKEFFVYVGLLSVFLNFSIKQNLLYFIAKDPANEKVYSTNTNFLLLVTSIIGLIGVYLFRNEILELTTYNFILPLLVFLFLFQNLDIIDFYWLAKKKSLFVLYYSIIRAVIRVISVVLTAYFTNDVLTIIYVLIILEFLKFLFLFFYFIKLDLIFHKVNWKLLKEQLYYIVPLGIATILLEFNRDISKVIISANLGASILALYAVASQNLPVVTIVRSSVADVIFPDMAEKIATDPLGALKLWSKSNIIYLFLMSPIFFILFVYSDVFIRVLFTSDYLAAVPIFQVYLFFFLKQCFEMGIPIRAMNKNKFFLIGYIFTALINIGLLYLLFRVFGLLGPAIAYVMSELILGVYYAVVIIKIYKIKLSQLFFWKKVFTILGIGAVLTPVLLAGKFLPFEPVTTSIVLSIVYLSLYLLLLHRYDFEEVNIIMKKVFRRLNLSW